MSPLQTFHTNARQRLVRAGEDTGDFLVKKWTKLGKWVDARFGDELLASDGAVSQAFKADATAIEEAPIPVPINAALYVVLALLGFAILWAIFGTLDRIVVGSGKIATRTPLVVMQPFTTSRILKLHVLAGDHVRKGQILVTFDPAFAQADAAALEHKVKSLNAQAARIEAEMTGVPYAPHDPANAEEKTQLEIFQQEAAQYAAEMAQRDSRVAALNAQIKAQNSAIVGYSQQLDMAHKVIDIYQRLLDQKAGAPLDIMKAQSNAIDFDMRLRNAMGEEKRLSQQRVEVQQERQSFIDKWRSDHNQQLVQARRDLAEASQSLNKAHTLRDFSELRAPSDAVVLEVADRSVGSVLREAETIVTLVPDNAELYIEAKIPSRDISYIKTGNKVRVKLEAYPFQRYGTLDGTLAVLSADSVPLKQESETQLVYRAQVKLLESPRSLAAKGFRLKPGMVATAEIKTGKRSIVSYILNPILRTADEGLREP